MIPSHDQVVAVANALLQRPPIVLTLEAAHAWVVLSYLQLALRHPAAQHGPAAHAVRDLARALQASVAPDGVLHEVAERGWDEAAEDET